MMIPDFTNIMKIVDSNDFRQVCRESDKPIFMSMLGTMMDMYDAFHKTDKENQILPEDLVCMASLRGEVKHMLGYMDVEEKKEVKDDEVGREDDKVQSEE